MFFFFFKKHLIFLCILTKFIKSHLYHRTKSPLFFQAFHALKLIFHIIFSKKQCIKLYNLTHCLYFILVFIILCRFQEYPFSKHLLILSSYTTNLLLFFFILTRNLLSDFHTLNIISAA